MKQGIKIGICFLLSLVMIESLYGQVEIDQRVIGSSGSVDTTTSVIISSTIGEAIIQTSAENGSPIVLSQGFQQSLDGDTIQAQLTTFGASCIGQNNGFAQLDSILGCQGPYTILWSNGDTGVFANNMAPGNYTVQITSSDNCNQTWSFTIGLVDNNNCLLKFYSGITPNNDGLNDRWEIDNINLFPNNEVNIYNRLGNRVWEGKNYDNVNVIWGGENLSGNDLPSDTYFYVFEVGSQVEKGWIELTR